MMKMPYLSLLTLLFLLFIGCHMGDYNESLVSKYELGAIDEEVAMSIYYSDNGMGIGVVNPTVFAVGYNEEYIIVKQHPRRFPNPPNKSITNYFIIPIKNKIHKSPDENKIGPLTKEEFVIKRNELDIPDSVTFTKILKGLE